MKRMKTDIYGEVEDDDLFMRRFVNVEWKEKNGIPYLAGQLLKETEGVKNG